MDTSQIRGRRPLSEVNGEARFSENGILFLEERLIQHQARQSLVLWRSPLRTLYYFMLETLVLFRKHGLRYLTYIDCLSVVVEICTSNLLASVT